MGIFGKIKDAVTGVVDKATDVFGGVIDGVVDLVDDVTGIDLGDVFDNKWVQGALMAATLFTGGVAIVNGVMQGWSAATQATGFFNTFVAAGEGFLQGAMTGLTSPLATAKDIWSQAGTATGLWGTTTPVSALETTASLGDVSGLEAADRAGASFDGTGIAGSAGPDMGAEQFASLDTGAGAGAPSLLGPKSLDPATIPGASAIPYPGAGASFAEGIGEGIAGSDIAAIGDVGGKSIGGAAPTSGGSGWLETLKKGGSAVANNPMLVYSGAQLLGGWAEGKAADERWDQLQKEERRRRNSYTGFADRAPTVGAPSLTALGNRNNQSLNRSDQAQAKYGY